MPKTNSRILMSAKGIIAIADKGSANDQAMSDCMAALMKAWSEGHAETFRKLCKGALEGKRLGLEQLGPSLN